MALSAEDRSDLPRWILSGAFVLLVHVGIVTAFLAMRMPEDFSAPGTMITLDLLPVPLEQEAEQSALPPGPEQVQAEAVPQQPEEKPEEKVEQEVPEAPNPEVAIEVPQPRPEQTPEPQIAAPATTAPQVARTSNPNAMPNWKTQIVALLERNKRYPPEARARHQQGKTQLAFTLDRQGHLVASRIVHGSGYAALDAEALALVQRVEPFPPPPSEYNGPLTLTVPIVFNIR